MATKKKKKRKPRKPKQLAKPEPDQAPEAKAETEAGNGMVGMIKTLVTFLTGHDFDLKKDLPETATNNKKKIEPKTPKQLAEPEPTQAPEAKAEAEAGNGMTGMIKALIIVSTFVSIAVLSVFSQGGDDNWPGVGVVAIRFSLLSVSAMIYFLMLYFTRLSRQKDEQKPSGGKK
jgi:hypothetical protein